MSRRIKILRIDDVGASTKKFEQYGRKLFRYKNIPFFYFPLANFWFFKRLPPFRRMGIYQELTAEEWRHILEIFRHYNIVPIVAITACWVDARSRLIPFPEKYPAQAELLKKSVNCGEISIANHGLTHCIPGKHLPKFWGSNRSQHREFWPEMPEEFHRDHIYRSQQILEGFFNRPIKIFIPPGNVWSIKTYYALQKTNIQTIIANRYMADSKEPLKGITFINDSQNYRVIHDRDIKLHNNSRWLINLISTL